MKFNQEELEIIRELLSSMSCHHERTQYFYHCCDAAEIVNKIDRLLVLEDKK